MRLSALAVLALVAAVVLGWAQLVPVALVLLGSAYAVHLAGDDAALDARAPFFAAGLLLSAELAYWSLEAREGVHEEAGEGLRHLGLVALLALGGLVAASMLLAVADLTRTEGLAIDLLGAAAAAGALLVVLLYGRRTG